MKIQKINEFFDFYKEPSYEEKVKSGILDIICDVNGISEKIL